MDVGSNPTSSKKHLLPSGRRHRTHNPLLIWDAAGSNPARCNIAIRLLQEEKFIFFTLIKIIHQKIRLRGIRTLDNQNRNLVLCPLNY